MESSTDACSLGGLEGIAELLRCYICMEGLKETSLCPHCCKLVCFSCITRWISENRADCPHCRVGLTVRELVKMPLFDDLVGVVEDLRGEEGEAPSNEVQNCSTHNQTLSVYCEPCKTAICHECALWGSSHKGHSFQPLESLHKKNKLALERELHKLKDRMRDILSFVLQVEQKVEGVRANKLKTKKEIQQVMEKMYSKADGKSKERLTKLADCRHFLRSQALKVMRTAHELESKIASRSYWSVVNDHGELRKELRDSLDKLYSHPLKMEALTTSAAIPNELVPNYTSGVFRLHPFSQLQLNGEEVYSTELRMDGLTWRLKVYPNGHHEDVGRYLAVFMELSDGYDKGPTSYQYSIQMLYGCSNKYPSKNYTKDYVSEFGDGECWGYKKYYQLSKLAPDGFIKDNALILNFSVRQLSYHDKAKDLSLHVSRVVEERNNLRDELKKAQKQLSILKTENKKLAASVKSRGSPKQTTRKPTTHYIPTHTHSLSNSERSQPQRYPLSQQSPSHTLSPKRSGYEAHLALVESRRRSHDIGPRHNKLIESRRHSADTAAPHDGVGDGESGSDPVGGELEEEYQTLCRADLSQAEDLPLAQLTIDSEMHYLSQPSSPPKIRARCIVDTPSHSQQHLSSSEYTTHYYDCYHGNDSREALRWFHDGRIRRPVVKPSSGPMRRMRSDPYLSSNQAPKAAVGSLKRVEEEASEVSTKPNKSRSLNRKHLRATVVERSPEQLASSGVGRSQASQPTNQNHLSTPGLAGGKSNSTSSLNLSQIL